MWFLSSMKIKEANQLNRQKEWSLSRGKIGANVLMCTKRIRCLLTLGKTVDGGRNEAQGSSLQRATHTNCLTQEYRHGFWWITISAGMWQCTVVTKHADLTGYFSQYPGLLNIHNFYVLWDNLLCSAFSRRHLSDRECQWSESFVEGELEIFWM